MSTKFTSIHFTKYFGLKKGKANKPLTISGNCANDEYIWLRMEASFML